MRQRKRYSPVFPELGNTEVSWTNGVLGHNHAFVSVAHCLPLLELSFFSLHNAKNLKLCQFFYAINLSAKLTVSGSEYVKACGTTLVFAQALDDKQEKFPQRAAKDLFHVETFCL